MNTFCIHQWSSYLSFTGTNYISVRPYLVVNKMNMCVCVHVCVCWCILTPCRQVDEDDWKGWWRTTGAVSTVSFYRYTTANENQYRQQVHAYTFAQLGAQLYIKHSGSSWMLILILFHIKSSAKCSYTVECLDTAGFKMQTRWLCLL